MDFVSDVYASLKSGGPIIVVLLLVSGFMWGAISVRAYHLIFVCKKISKNYSLADISRAYKTNPIELCYAKIAFAISSLSPSNKSEEAINKIKRRFLGEIENELAFLKNIVFGLVTVAPLLGLLGTVTGMIDTFEAIGEMNLFSSDGGIAGGISKALLTTQIGLIIAVPGVILERILTRRSRELVESIDVSASSLKLKGGML